VLDSLHVARGSGPGGPPRRGGADTGAHAGPARKRQLSGIWSRDGEMVRANIAEEVVPPGDPERLCIPWVSRLCAA
jgi:hypothetical protein